jgi:hypothetical protein
MPGQFMVKSAQRTAFADAAKLAAEKGVANLAAEDVATIGRSKAGEWLVNKADRINAWRNKLSENAAATTEKFFDAMGRPIEEQLGKGMFGSSRGALGNVVKTAVEKIPAFNLGKHVIDGSDIYKFFNYSNTKAVNAARLKDSINVLGREGNFFLDSHISGKGVVQDIRELYRDLGPQATANEIRNQIKGVLASASEMKDYTTKIPGVNLNPKTGLIHVADTMENAEEIMKIYAEDLSRENLMDAYKKIGIGQTGVQWFDDWMTTLKEKTVGGTLDKWHMGGIARSIGMYDAVKDWRPLEKMIKANDVMISFFKPFKVGAGALSSFTNAIFGNATFLAMAGGPVTDGKLQAEIGGFAKLLLGRQRLTYLSDTFLGDWEKVWNENPGLFQMMFGIDPVVLKGKISFEKTFLRKGEITFKELVKEFEKIIKEAPIAVRNQQRAFTTSWIDEYEEALKLGTVDKLDPFVRDFGEKHFAGVPGYEAWRDPKDFLSPENYAKSLERPPVNIDVYTEEGRKMAEKKSRDLRPLPSPIETSAGKVKDGVAYTSTTGSSYGANEMVDVALFNRARETARQNLLNAKTAKEKALWGSLDLILSKLPNAFEAVDQSFKFGTANHLVKYGWPRENMLRLSRMVDIKPEDIIKGAIEDGKQLYKLTPNKAMEAVGEIYMNYSAMPDFVKIVRAMPFLGHPFFSFTYAMTAKTGKTLIHNPAIFNKIGFGMKEWTGTRTPEERAALENKYNEYLNSPTVVRIAKMWNTDFKNLLPYYTLNTFMPSERKYDGTLPNTVLSVIDKSPFMKSPFGQVLFDYVMQPYFLSENQVPQGQFGQPLYPSFDTRGRPIHAGIGTRSFYAARTLADSMMPGVLGYLGAANVFVGARPETTDWIPGYGARSLANAGIGASSIGVLTKEDAMLKTVRKLFSMSGVPLYVLDTTQISNK